MKRYGNELPAAGEFVSGLPENRYRKTFPVVYRRVGTGREGGDAVGSRKRMGIHYISLRRERSGNKSGGTDIDL